MLPALSVECFLFFSGKHKKTSYLICVKGADPPARYWGAHEPVSRTPLQSARCGWWYPGPSWWVPPLKTRWTSTISHLKSAHGTTGSDADVHLTETQWRWPVGGRKAGEDALVWLHVIEIECSKFQPAKRFYFFIFPLSLMRALEPFGLILLLGVKWNCSLGR